MTLDPKKLEEILGYARQFVPSVRPDRSPAPRQGKCPVMPPGSDAYCWKFENPNPLAFYDFFLIASFIRDAKTGQSVQALDFVPLDDGGYVITSTHVEYAEIESNRYVKTLKLSHQNFGVVQLTRLKVNELYEGLNRTIFALGNDFVRFNMQGQPVEYKTGAHVTFPPLPQGDRLVLAQPSLLSATQRGGDDLTYRLSQRDAFNTRATDAIQFPKSKPVEFDSSGRITDYEVSDGDVCPPDFLAQRSLLGNVRPVLLPGGVAFEIAVQPGDPSYNCISVYRFDANGVPQLVFEKMCTGFSYEDFRQHVFVKKHSSWFKTKTKIKTITEEFRMKGERCSEFLYPQIPD